MTFTYIYSLLIVQKDTKALICDLQMPQVYSKVVRWHIGDLIAIHWYRVYMIRVGVGKGSSRTGFDHQVHGFKNGHA